MASEKSEVLEKLIREYKREEIRTYLKKGILKELSGEEKDRILLELVSLRDSQIMKILSKELKTFDPQMLDIDCSNWQNRNFIIEILNKYSGKFDWTDSQVCEKLFDLACRVTHPGTVERLIRQKEALSRYYKLAGSADDLFILLKNIKPSGLTAEQRLDIILEAATSEQGTERLRQLAEWGYDLKERNAEGVTISVLLEEKIRNTRYAKNRSGELQKKKDKNALSYLYSIQNPQPEKGEENEKPDGASSQKRLILIVLLICVALVAGYLCYHVVRDSGSDDSGVESELSVESETESSTDEDSQ